MDFKILGQFVSPLVHDSALENFIWKDLRREGKAGPLYCLTLSANWISREAGWHSM